MKKHVWLQIHSSRTQPYTLEDISVIIPSAAGRYENRWKWFWSQYVANTHPDVVKRTIVPCDEAETSLPVPSEQLLIVEPRWIVNKTIGALDYITTRLTFRLANDILVVRKGWEEILLKQFNDQERLQIISEIQHGTAYPDTIEKLQRDWDYLKREYSEPTTAAVYPHGSRIFAQTAVWNAYYRQVLRYTSHEHDELFFSQLARGDGTIFVHWGGSRAYLAHIGITNKDFSNDYLTEIEKQRKHYEVLPTNAGFRIIE